MRMLAVVLTVLVLAPATASAQQIRVEFNGGTVILRAENAPIRTILAEWSKQGGTRIINGDRVGGGPVTLELNGVPELQALEILLRGVAGYLVGRREIVATGPGLNNPSMFDRIHILPTSSAPRAAGPTPVVPAPRPPAIPRPLASPFEDDADIADGDLDPEPRPNPSAVPGGTRQPVRGVAGPLQIQEEAAPPAPQQPARGNPFGAVTGSPRPGIVLPPVERTAPRETPE